MSCPIVWQRGAGFVVRLGRLRNFYTYSIINLTKLQYALWEFLSYIRLEQIDLRNISERDDAGAISPLHDAIVALV